MGLYDKDKAVELRILGPHGKLYLDLEKEFTEPFREEGFDFLVPRLFSAPPETTVLVTIGISVITGVSTHLLVSLVDRIFKLKKGKEQKQTTVMFNIHVGDKYINLPDNEESELFQELEKIKKEALSHKNASKK